MSAKSLDLRTGASSCVGVEEPVEIAFAAESMLESPRHIFGEDVPVVPGPYRDDCGLPELVPPCCRFLLHHPIRASKVRNKCSAGQLSIVNFEYDRKNRTGQEATKIMSDHIIHHHNDDSIDRQGFLKFMAWAGTGVFCVLKGGALKSCSLSQLVHDASSMKGDLGFVRISDNHVGFNKPTNPEVTASLRTWLIQEHSIQEHVTLESSEPCDWRVTGNIQ
jgi:hypothetical protein